VFVRRLSHCKPPYGLSARKSAHARSIGRATSLRATVGDGNESGVNSEPVAPQYFSAAYRIQKRPFVRPSARPGAAGKRAGGCRRNPRPLEVRALVARAVAVADEAEPRAAVLCPDAAPA